MPLTARRPSWRFASTHSTTRRIASASPDGYWLYLQWLRSHCRKECVPTRRPDQLPNSAVGRLSAPAIRGLPAQIFARRVMSYESSELDVDVNVDVDALNSGRNSRFVALEV